MIINMKSYGSFEYFKKEVEEYMSDPYNYYEKWSNVSYGYTKIPNFYITSVVKKHILRDKYYIHIRIWPESDNDYFDFIINDFDIDTVMETKEKVDKWIESKCNFKFVEGI